MTSDTIVPNGESTDLATVDQAAPLGGEIQLSAHDVRQQVGLIQQVMRSVMRDGEHFGKIPGCGDKPTLLKPGAEKLAMTFRLAPRYELERVDLPGGHREVHVRCILSHIATEKFVGEGVGSCSSLETRYRYRRISEPTGEPVPAEYWDLRQTDPKGAQELLGGKGYRPEKIDGIWMIVTSRRVENPDLADTFNTVLKIAKKRALVDAILTATAASDIFTQDIEELEPDDREPASSTTQHNNADAPPRRKVENTAAPQPGPTVKVLGSAGADRLIAKLKSIGVSWERLIDRIRSQSEATYTDLAGIELGEIPARHLSIIGQTIESFEADAPTPAEISEDDIPF